MYLKEREKERKKEREREKERKAEGWVMRKENGVWEAVIGRDLGEGEFSILRLKRGRGGETKTWRRDSKEGRKGAKE